MGNKINRDVKILLLSGIPFGLAMGIWFSYKYGIQTGLIGGGFAGLFFGVVMFFMLGFFHIRAVKKLTGGNADLPYGVHHVRDINLEAPYDTSFKLCISSLDLIKNCKIKEQGRSLGRIVARTGINWKTWGDTITFELGKLDSGYTHIKVLSRPTARTTLVDYGKNLENIKTIVSFLKRHNPVNTSTETS